MILNSFFSRLPFDIIREILLYDSHFVLRNNTRIICINKIPKSDFRFMLYDKIPKIYQLSPNCSNVIICKKKKYIIRHYLRSSLIWEYSFSIFSKDPHTNMICSIPDSMSCIPLYM